METMERNRPRPHRPFTPEFKSEVVTLVRQSGIAAGSVGREVDLTETAARSWVKQTDIDEGARIDGLSSAERAELRRENRTLHEERDILKRTTAFFARETR